MITYSKEVLPSLEEQTRLEILGNLDSLLFFDIETTGFNRTTDHVISITFLYLENKAWIIQQLFAESKDEEVLLLKNAKVLFDQKKVHITYNGNTFDIPFLKVKYHYYNISASLNKSKSYDLYRIAKSILTLENYKLKSIEQHIGINRLDQLSGLQCIEYYNNYLATKEMHYANLILEHNFEDVLNLIALTKILDYLSSEKLSLFKIRYFECGAFLYYYKSINLKNDFIEISLWRHIINSQTKQINPHEINNHFYDNGAQIVMDVSSELSIRVPIYNKKINDDFYVIFDYSSFDITQFQFQDENSLSNILQFNQYFIYENISSILNNLFKKAFELT